MNPSLGRFLTVDSPLTAAGCYGQFPNWLTRAASVASSVAALTSGRRPLSGVMARSKMARP
jgi:hypothetical protein